MNKHFFTLIFITVLWGSSYTFIKIILEVLPVEIFQTWRYFFALLIIMVLFRKQLKGLSLKSFNIGFFTVGVSAFLASWFTIIGIKLTTATQTAFMVSLPIVIVPILSFIHFKQKLTFKYIFSIILAFLGVLVLTEPWKNYFQKGDILLFIAAIAYSYQYISISCYVKKENAARTVFVQFSFVFISFLFLSIFSIFRENLKLSNLFVLGDYYVWLVVIFIGFFITGLAWFFEAKAQKEVSAIVVVIIFATEPVFTLVTEWGFEGQPLSFVSLLGGFLIVLASVISALKDKKKL